MSKYNSGNRKDWMSLGHVGSKDVKEKSLMIINILRLVLQNGVICL